MQGSPGLVPRGGEVVPEHEGGREEDGDDTGKAENDRAEDHDEHTNRKAQVKKM